LHGKIKGISDSLITFKNIKMANNYKDYSNDEVAILDYVHGRLQGQALMDFENALSQHNSLAQEVLLRKQLAFIAQNQEAVQAAHNLSKWLIDNPLAVEPPTWSQKLGWAMTRNWFWGVCVAAAIGWGAHEYRLNRFAKARFTHFESRTAPNAADMKLQQALQAYNQKAYAQAAPHFDTYLQTNADDLEIRLYAGVSHLAKGEATLALSQLIVFQEDITDEAFKPFQKQGQYYLALTYLQLGKKGKAVEILSKMKDLQEAKNLLNELN
jgi:hypothetical protein